MRISDWSSDVCSSDLRAVDRQHQFQAHHFVSQRGRAAAPQGGAGGQRLQGPGEQGGETSHAASLAPLWNAAAPQSAWPCPSKARRGRRIRGAAAGALVGRGLGGTPGDSVKLSKDRKSTL